MSEQQNDPKFYRPANAPIKPVERTVNPHLSPQIDVLPGASPERPASPEQVMHRRCGKQHGAYDGPIAVLPICSGCSIWYTFDGLQAWKQMMLDEGQK